MQRISIMGMPNIMSSSTTNNEAKDGSITTNINTPAAVAPSATAAASAPARPKQPLSAFNLFYRFKRTKVLEMLASNIDADKETMSRLVEAPPGLEDTSTANSTQGLSPDQLNAHRRTNIRHQLENNLFARDTRDRSHRKNQSAMNGAMSFVELGKLMNTSWKSCDEFAKSVFKELSQEGRERYRHRVQEYNERSVALGLTKAVIAKGGKKKGESGGAAKKQHAPSNPKKKKKPPVKKKTEEEPSPTSSDDREMDLAKTMLQLQTKGSASQQESSTSLGTSRQAASTSDDINMTASSRSRKRERDAPSLPAVPNLGQGDASNIARTGSTSLRDSPMRANFPMVSIRPASTSLLQKTPSIQTPSNQRQRATRSSFTLPSPPLGGNSAASTAGGMASGSNPLLCMPTSLPSTTTPRTLVSLPSTSTARTLLSSLPSTSSTTRTLMSLPPSTLASLPQAPGTVGMAEGSANAMLVSRVQGIHQLPLTNNPLHYHVQGTTLPASAGSLDHRALNSNLRMTNPASISEQGAPAQRMNTNTSAAMADNNVLMSRVRDLESQLANEQLRSRVQDLEEEVVSRRAREGLLRSVLDDAISWNRATAQAASGNIGHSISPTRNIPSLLFRPPDRAVAHGARVSMPSRNVVEQHAQQQTAAAMPRGNSDGSGADQLYSQGEEGDAASLPLKKRRRS